MSAFTDGVRDALVVGVGVVIYGVVFGSLAQTAGLSLAQAVGMSLIVYSGSAQLVSLPLLQMGAPAGSIVLTVVAMSLRHIVMGLSLSRYLGHLRLLPRMILAYAVNDESYAITTMRIARNGFQASYFMGAGLVMFIAWTVSTALGHVAGQFLPSPSVLGLDFAFTALFIALLVPQVRSRPAAIAVVVGAVLSVGTSLVAGVGVAIAVGGAGGALAAGLVDRDT
jgi:4-azaleucine resistance transporter AzlC